MTPLCSCCHERPKRRRAGGRIDGSLCVECHGLRHKAARKAYRKRMREARPGYLSRGMRGQIATYRRACDDWKGEWYPTLRRPSPSLVVLREAGLSPAEVRRACQRISFQVNTASPRFNPKNERWRALAAAASDGTVTHEALAVLLLARTSCAYCGASLPVLARSFDHVVELSSGGAHSMSNLTIACLPCNRSKGGRAGGAKGGRVAGNRRRKSLL